MHASYSSCQIVDNTGLNGLRVAEADIDTGDQNRWPRDRPFLRKVCQAFSAFCAEHKTAQEVTTIVDCSTGGSTDLIDRGSLIGASKLTAEVVLKFRD